VPKYIQIHQCYMIHFRSWPAACRLDCYKILLAGTRFTKSLVLFGGWQAACRLDCYKLRTKGLPCLSYSLAHLAVPYRGRQDARLEPKYILKIHPFSITSCLDNQLAPSQCVGRRWGQRRLHHPQGANSGSIHRQS
jgi:hypothetical protein